MSLVDDLKCDLAELGIRLPANVSLNPDDWAGALTANPGRNNAAVVGLAAVLFYAAEKGHNPKVHDIFDAMIYTSTCLSVGYGDIFAHTPIGKLIGTALMTYGPALSNAALNQRPPERGEDALAESQRQIHATLQQILAQLTGSS
jgi:hypothetical protein